jgi:mono/diheme cytochrome c family protein
MRISLRSLSSLRARAALGVVALVVMVVAFRGSAARTFQSQSGDAARPSTNARGALSEVEARGEYLANNVAMCVQCHSPRDERGNILVNEKFTGAPMPVRGPDWAGPWAYRTPSIAGLHGFTDDQIVMLLTEGHLGDRPAPSRPMPPFRMNKQDAEAIVAYLRTK